MATIDEILEETNEIQEMDDPWPRPPYLGLDTTELDTAPGENSDKYKTDPPYR